MPKDLTSSSINRQNVINNKYALAEIKKSIGIKCIQFNGKEVLLKEQVAEFFEVSVRTIELYLQKHESELQKSGYEILRGKPLQDLKNAIISQYGTEIYFGTKTTIISIFDFKAFLNLAMLITESERAKLLRQLILDVVIDTINKRTGGGTKYINQRDEEFIFSYFHEKSYRKEFTDALKDYVDMGNFKYPLYTDKIYVSIFREKASEYRKVLKLQEKESVRDTFYAEILDLISSYECGFADILKNEYTKKGRKLSVYETDSLFRQFESQAHWKPLINKARQKMASRDFAFRDVLHHQLTEYLQPLEVDEFERFLGEKSKELADRLEEAKDVMKRLKDRE